MNDADQDDKTQVLSRPKAPAQEAPPGVLRCVDTSVLKDGKGAQILLEGTMVSIGRGSENDITLNASGISRHHARLVAGDGLWRVEDLGSTNGTRVNNSRVDGSRDLVNGDTLAFGRVCYKYTVREASETTGGHDIDLGGSDRTVVMRPGAGKAAASSGATTTSVTTRIGGGRGQEAGPGDTGSRRKPAPAPRSGPGAGVWVLVLVVVAAVAAGAAYALGLI